MIHHNYMLLNFSNIGKFSYLSFVPLKKLLFFMYYPKEIIFKTDDSHKLKVLHNKFML